MTLKAFDVAIGVVLLYLLLTLVSSVLVELLSTMRNWRAQMLYAAIQNMLADNRIINGDDIYNSPFIEALGRQQAAHSYFDLFEPFGWRPAGKDTQPSYIPSAAFSNAVIYQLWRRGPECLAHECGADRWEHWPQHQCISPDSTIRLFQSLLAHYPSDDALWAILVTALATQGASVQGVRLAIEKWFNDTMDRVSGWYKRRAQACLLLLGVGVAFSANINTITVANWLWNGDTARQAIVAAASDIAKASSKPPGDSSAIENVAKQVMTAETLTAAQQFPLGWGPARIRDFWWASYLVGCLISAIAISMGSSFWFDALQNILSLRGTGPKPSAR